jgi:hypothetical protein
LHRKIGEPLLRVDHITEKSGYTVMPEWPPLTSSFWPVGRPKTGAEPVQRKRALSDRMKEKKDAYACHCRHYRPIAAVQPESCK